MELLVCMKGGLGDWEWGCGMIFKHAVPIAD